VDHAPGEENSCVKEEDVSGCDTSSFAWTEEGETITEGQLLLSKRRQKRMAEFVKKCLTKGRGCANIRKSQRCGGQMNPELPKVEKKPLDKRKRL
jgi:hypothetical protein